MTDDQLSAAEAAPPATDPTVAALEQELAAEGVLVGIVMGSQSDMETMQKAAKELTDRGIPNEINVMSAHRDPDKVAAYAKSARSRGLKVIIAGAGLSAALPGVVAAHTDLPVIGVPLTSSMTAARRARRAAVGRADAAGRAGRLRRRSTTRKTPPRSRRGSSAPSVAAAPRARRARA